MSDDQASSVQPKGEIVDGNIKCPHCGTLTNGAYKWHPALSCYSCGRDMWLDDRGRSISGRRALSRAGMEMFDSEDDKERIRRMYE